MSDWVTAKIHLLIQISEKNMENCEYEFSLLKNILSLKNILYSLNMNQSKSTDYQWNFTDSNSLKRVTVN